MLRRLGVADTRGFERRGGGAGAHLLRRVAWAWAAAIALSPSVFAACSSSGAPPELPPSDSSAAPYIAFEAGAVPDTGSPDVRTDAREGSDSADVTEGADAMAASGITPFDAGGLCSGVVASGPVAEEVAQPGSQPPPAGGPLLDGTYVLQRIYTYSDEAGAGSGGLEEQKSLRIQAGTYTWAQATATPDAGSGGANVTGGIFTVAGTSVTLIQYCPADASDAALGTSIGYTASGSGLYLYLDEVVEFYMAM